MKKFYVLHIIQFVIILIIAFLAFSNFEQEPELTQINSRTKLRYDIQNDQYDIDVYSGQEIIKTYKDVNAELVFFRPHNITNSNLSDEWNRDGHSVSLQYYRTVIYVDEETEQIVKVVVYIYFEE